MKPNKRIPTKWETYHSKDWSELTVMYYWEEKDLVTYYKHWRVFTTKLKAFVAKLPKEERE